MDVTAGREEPTDAARPCPLPWPPGQLLRQAQPLRPLRRRESAQQYSPPGFEEDLRIVELAGQRQRMLSEAAGLSPGARPSANRRQGEIRRHPVRRLRWREAARQLCP